LRPDGSKPAYGLWLVSLASVIWLGVAVILMVTRLSEWWPLFQPPMSRERLSLSEIGLFLIAAFAPLTFLLLLVAVLLQQRGLSLQQKALEATRHVLSAQQRGLDLQQKALQATRHVLSAQQQGYERMINELMGLTRIMNETVDATRATIVYDEFSLQLYFLAKEILTEAAHVSVTVQPGMTVSLFRSPTHFDLTERHSSVDALLGLFENWLRHGVIAVLDGVSRIDTMDKQRTATFLEKVRLLNSTITSLLQRYRSNPLVVARVTGIKLKEIQQLLQAVEAKWV
jgi:hypothetical protein